MSVYLKWNQIHSNIIFQKRKKICENISIAKWETLNEKSNGALNTYTIAKEYGFQDVERKFKIAVDSFCSAIISHDQIKMTADNQK